MHQTDIRGQYVLLLPMFLNRLDEEVMVELGLPSPFFFLFWFNAEVTFKYLDELLRTRSYLHISRHGCTSFMHLDAEAVSSCTIFLAPQEAFFPHLVLPVLMVVLCHARPLPSSILCF